jgi:hypothetical protein
MIFASFGVRETKSGGFYYYLRESSRGALNEMSAMPPRASVQGRT